MIQSFNKEKTYSKGDVVLFNGGTYVFVTDHMAGEFNIHEVVLVKDVLMPNNTLPDHNFSRPMQSPRFKVYYDVNSDDTMFLEPNFYQDFVDYNTYAYGDTAKAIPVNPDAWKYYYYSSDGLKRYNLQGWSLDRASLVLVTDPFVIQRDVTLYAVWSSQPTIEVIKSSESHLYIDETDAYFTVCGFSRPSVIPVLNIPEYYEGTRVTYIQPKPDSTLPNVKIKKLILPASIKVLRPSSFYCIRVLEEIIFTDGEVTEKYTSLKIDPYAFKYTENVKKIILPYRTDISYLQKNSLSISEISQDMIGKIFYIRNPRYLVSATLTDQDLCLQTTQSSNPVKIFWRYNK